MPSLPRRKRATAIIEYPEGILLAVMRYMSAALPGGGVKQGESDEAAVIREVREETSLRVVKATFLFRYSSLANDHAVFWVLAEGQPRPCEEVDQIAYYHPEAKITISPETKSLLDHFYRYKVQHPDLSVAINQSLPS